MAEWKVNKSQRVCAVSEKVFEVGNTFFSALKEEGESFVRYDYSEEAWANLDKSDIFSFWKSHLQSNAQHKRSRLKIDSEAFYTFFSSLQNREEGANEVFKYLLALILIRKRLLRLEEIEKSPDGEALIIFDTRTKNELRIEVPEVTDAAIKDAKEELEQIFECSTDDV